MCSGLHQDEAGSGECQTRRGRGRPSLGARQAILDAARELIRDEGLSHLTTREVARRAGVSDASVFYHFQDKAGLLVSCMNEALVPLKTAPLGLIARETLTDFLLRLSAAVERFYDQTMPLFATVQSDSGLRQEFSERLLAGDRGVHQGVRFVKAQLRPLVDAGLVRPDADLEAAAFLLIGACFVRSWQRLLAGGGPETRLPKAERTVATLVELLSPRSCPSRDVEHENATEKER